LNLIMRVVIIHKMRLKRYLIFIKLKVDIMNNRFFKVRNLIVIFC
jgi:hypothetical protein